MQHHGNTVDGEIFAVNKFSSVPYDDENLKRKKNSTLNNKNVEQKTALAEAMKIKQH